MADVPEYIAGRYHIREQIGQGGMAVVYKAYDMRLGRDVAIKRIRTELFGQAVIERILKRFEREGKSLARLNHANIVKVYDYGEYEGSPYLVMEYIPGGTLKDIIGKPIPWQQAIKLLSPIAAALQAAHQQGILHRDVKPGNILISEDLKPVLTDFGIAKLLEDLDGGDSGSFTSLGVGVGTPEYMAPEQGMGQALDGRADLYALGLVFYELVTGRKPFIADTPLAVVYKQINDPPLSPRGYVSDLPEDVEKTLLKALEKRPADRFQDMSELIRELEQLSNSGGKGGNPSFPVSKPQTLKPAFVSTGSGLGEETRDEPAAGLQQAQPGNGLLKWFASQPGWVRLVAAGLSLGGITLLLLAMGILVVNSSGLLRGFGAATEKPLSSNTIPANPAGFNEEGTSESDSLEPSATRGQTAVIIPMTETPLQPADTAQPIKDWRQGKMVFTMRMAGGGAELVLLDMETEDYSTIQTANSENYLLGASISPDGTQVAYYAYPDTLYLTDLIPGSTPREMGQCQSPTWDIQSHTILCRASGNVFKWVGGNSISGVHGLIAALSPDGQYLVYAVLEDGSTKIYRSGLEGGSVLLLAGSASENYAPSVSPDGNWVAFQSNEGSSNSEIWMMRLDGSEKRRLTFSAPGGWARAPAWSPDGQWLGYTSSQSGSAGADLGEVFVVDIQTGTIEQVTHTGGRVYDWRVSWSAK